MMASLYSTPPPDTTSTSSTSNVAQSSSTSTMNATVDFNGEDASVLSDTSNSSHTNSSINSQNQQQQSNKAPKRSIVVTSPSTTSSMNNYPGLLGNLNLFDTSPDLSKKRRKQTTPIRISAFDLSQQQQQQLLESINTNGLSSSASSASALPNSSSSNNNTNNDNDITEINDDDVGGDEDEDLEDESSANNCNSSNNNNNNVNNNDGISEKDEGSMQIPSLENDGLQKIFLKNLSQLQASVAAAAQAQNNNENIDHQNSSSRAISPTTKLLRASLSPMPSAVSMNLNLNHHQHQNGQQDFSTSSNKQQQQHDFENEIEYHNKMLKSNNNNDKTSINADGSINRHDKKPDDSWLSLASLPFPFPPEASAVAALSASGYLPQLPSLLSSSMGPFGSPDGVLARGAAPLRIFNPEAYCDLCNKEFCNKYFLKTHKANKHGIYEPMTPMGSGNEMPTLNQLSQMQQMSQVLQMQQQQFNQQQAAAAAAAVAQQKSQIMAQQQQQQQQQINSNANSSDVSVSQQAPPPQPNAFCDICFKKFSSPAALKKHRLKIHEIGIPKSSSSQQQQQISSSSSSSNSMPPQTQPVELTTNKLNTNNNNGSGDEQALQNENENKEQLQQQQNSLSMPFHFPEGFREDFQIEQEDTNFTPEPRKLSPASIQQAKEANFAYDKLKRLGVLNPEAFCELCCKEYCNKYFLRTHKLKRHGIFLPADDPKESPFWPYMQTSPLNLIMGGDLKALQMYAAAGKGKSLLENGDEIVKIPSPSLSECDENKDENNVNQMMKDDEEEKSNDDGKKSPQLTQQESEAISVDLQKLQSMILQLNELNQNRSVMCGICGKEMENQYMLHAHMLAEHSGFTNNNSIKLSPPPSSPNEFEVCKQCDKEFSNIFLLKQHLMEQHGMPPLSPPLRDGFITPDRKIVGAAVASMLSQPSTPTQNDRKPMFQMTPTSSYCEICNKELCNKYFMKTHMQRMHGIEIENGAQIGGVVCNICNKELCSKYFLRVHKHNTHGIVEDGSPQQRPGSESIDSDNGFQMDLKPGEVSDQSNRYFSHFTEVCPLCSRRFRSAKWLKAHLMGDHGKAGVEKLNEIEAKVGLIKGPPSPGLKIPNGGYNLASPELMIKTSLGGLFSGGGGVENSMETSPSGSSQATNNPLKGYQCSFCSFSTPILAILFIHERSHQASNTAMNLIQNNNNNNNNNINNKSESAVSLAKELSNSQQPTPGVLSPSSTPASTPIPSTPQESNSGKMEMMENTFQPIHPRPSVGLPQESGPLVMQSFLLEESSSPFSKSLVNGKTGTNENNKFIPSMIILPVRERISSPITISFTLTPA